MTSKKIEPRFEQDSFGSIEFPANCYWGVQTGRAKEQLFTCGLPLHPKLLESLLLVKKAAAVVNAEQGRLEVSIAKAIAEACDEAISGQWRDQFIAELLQAGAGNAININVNEVLANRAEEILGGNVGEYKIVHPDRHINLSQSVNDVFPTAMRLAILSALKEFEPVLLDLERLLRRKAVDFNKIIKIGRAHLRDSVPMTLGQEFNSFGSIVERAVKRLKEVSNCMLELNIGGTQIGTGWNTHPDYQNRMVETLTLWTKFRLKPGEDLLRLSQSMSDFVQVSSGLRELAIDLNKISSDLRLLGAGPTGGLAEINMPALASELSPLLPEVLSDQVNPFLAETLSMVCFQIIGNDASVVMAAQSGQLQTNVMSGAIIYNILNSIDLARTCVYAFNQKCLSKITANSEQCQKHFAQSGALFTALAEQIGLKKAQTLFAQYGSDGDKLRQALLKGNVVPAGVLEKIFNPACLTTPGIRPEVTDATPSQSKSD